MQFLIQASQTYVKKIYIYVYNVKLRESQSSQLSDIVAEKEDSPKTEKYWSREYQGWKRPKIPSSISSTFKCSFFLKHGSKGNKTKYNYILYQHVSYWKSHLFLKIQFIKKKKKQPILPPLILLWQPQTCFLYLCMYELVCFTFCI